MSVVGRGPIGWGAAGWSLGSSASVALRKNKMLNNQFSINMKLSFIPSIQMHGEAGVGSSYDDDRLVMGEISTILFGLVSIDI